jgi:hypothetical protein
VVRRCFPIQVPSVPGIAPTIMLTLSVAEFVSPAAVRSSIKKAQGEKYRVRKEGEVERGTRREKRRREEDELAVSKVFS